MLKYVNSVNLSNFIPNLIQKLNPSHNKQSKLNPNFILFVLKGHPNSTIYESRKSKANGLRNVNHLLVMIFQSKE